MISHAKSHATASFLLMSDRRLPPLDALRAFALSAQLGAFTRAAERLGVSQSAVTRQIAVLEANLGAKLFERGRRGVELTREGEAYFEEVAPAFDILSAATARLRQRREEEVLRLGVYPVFAVKWLIPRLADLQSWAPGVRIELDTSVEPIDFHRSPLDAAIQVVREPRGDIHTEMLLPDEVEPICSPGLLLDLGHAPTLDDLGRFNLIHARYRRADWPDWAAAQQRPDLAEGPGLEFPSSVLAYQAAQEGLGVAMGQPALLETDFARGVLVRPFRKPLRRSQGYHLITPADREPPLRVRALRAWLRKVCGRRA